MNSTVRTIQRLVVAVLVTAAALLGHGSVAAHPSGAGLPILRYNSEVGNPTWPATLDPAVATDGYSISVFDLVYGEFVRLDYHTYKILPDLATHWKVSKDHRTYRFYMRHNVRFSNGD